MPEIWKFDAPDPYEAMQAGMAQSRTNRLADMELAQKVRAEQQTKALNELMRTAVDPVTGKIDVNKLYGGMASQGYGAAVPNMQKEFAGLREAQGKADEQTGKAVLERMKMYRDLLPTDPAKAASWARAAHNDTVIGPYLGQMGSVEDTIAKIPTDPKKYQDWYNQMGLSVDDAIKRSTPTAEAMLPYTTPLSPEVLGQKKEIAGAGKSSVNVGVNTEKKFNEIIAGKAGERLDTYRENAEQAVRAIETNARLKPLINDPNFISGTFADARTAVARALGMDVSATESFFSGMAEQVASRIKAFGAGTGLSDSDRQYALAWAGGKPDLSAKGIARIMRINDESAKTSIKQYSNERQFLGKKNPGIFDYYPEITAKPTQPSGRDVVRTGTLNGRKVVQYSDGTTEYAD